MLLSAIFIAQMHVRSKGLEPTTNTPPSTIDRDALCLSFLFEAKTVNVWGCQWVSGSSLHVSSTRTA